MDNDSGPCLWCDSNVCGEQACHRCHTRRGCREHEKCVEATKEENGRRDLFALKDEDRPTSLAKGAKVRVKASGETKIVVSIDTSGKLYPPVWTLDGSGYHRADLEVVKPGKARGR